VCVWLLAAGESVKQANAQTVQIVGNNTSAATARDGHTLTIGYHISTDSSTPASLRCWLASPTGQLVDDPPDVAVTLNAGTEWYYRDFLVNLPPGATSGAYDVHWGVYWGADQAHEVAMPGYLTIQPPVSIRIPILSYQKVGPTAYTRYWVTPSAFRAQMKALKAYGYTSITLQNLMDCRAGLATPPAKPVLITFGDGYENLYTEAYPILADPEIDMKATGFIIPGMIGGTNAWDGGDNDPIINHLTWEQVDALYASGRIDIQSHTQTHKCLTFDCGLTPSERTYELVTAKQEIDSRLHNGCRFLSYPNGYRDATAEAAARDAGYFAAVTLGGLEGTCENKWALGRLFIDWNVSVNYDPTYPERFFMTVIQDPDVRIPRITIDSMTYLDPTTDLPVTAVRKGQNVKVRVLATNTGQSAGVVASLRLDDNANEGDGVVYDSHVTQPPEDVAATFGVGQQAFEWVIQTPAGAQPGQVGANVIFHDPYYVLSFHSSGWQPGFTITSTPADFDLDGDVDLGDFNSFQLCFNGPNRPPGAACDVAADFDGDADVDLTDFNVFQNCFNGPNRPPGCN